MKQVETWGIVGCGRVAENHAWAAREAGLRLRWACDKDLEKAAALAQKYGIERITRNPSDIRDDANTHFVSIATDHASHIRIAKQFLNTPAVLVEKPLALPSQDVEDFLVAVNDASVVFGVVSQHRCRSHIRRIRSALISGAFGKIDHVRARTLSKRQDQYYLGSEWRGTWAGAGGGALVNQGYHAIDILIYLLGVPHVTSARTWNRRPNVFEVEEGYNAALLFPQKISGEIFGTNAGAADWDVLVEVFGSKGYAVFDLNHPGGIREAVGVEVVNEEDDVRPPPGISYFGTSHLGVFRELVAAANGDGQATATVRDGVTTLNVIREIYRLAGVDHGFQNR